MYKNVLLTDKEILLIKRTIKTTMRNKTTPEARNLHHIYMRLDGIKPTKEYNQYVNGGK